MTTVVSPHAEAIEPQRLYRLDHAKRILGLGEWVWRRSMLPHVRTARVGNRKFVLGSDLIAAVQRSADHPRPDRNDSGNASESGAPC